MAGLALQAALVAHVRDLGLDIEDIGVDSPEEAAAAGVDCSDVAETLARGIAGGRWTRGILICGTGIGMAIAASKVPGFRAAQVHDVYSAERARRATTPRSWSWGPGDRRRAGEDRGHGVPRLGVRRWRLDPEGGKLKAIDGTLEASQCPSVSHPLP